MSDCAANFGHIIIISTCIYINILAFGAAVPQVKGGNPVVLISTCYTLVMTATTAVAAETFSVREATERDCDEIIRMVKVSHGRVFWVWGFGFGFLCICLSCYSEIPGID